MTRKRVVGEGEGVEGGVERGYRCKYAKHIHENYQNSMTNFIPITTLLDGIHKGR